MKGIIFGGCSFTWGQGLYFYSDLKDLPYGTQNYGFNYKEVNESMLRYKNAVRFPRLVSQHFETFEVVKEDIGKLYGNGGSEDETFLYFDYVFNVERKFKYNDFDYMIIQLSNVWRNDFVFELNGVKYKTKIMELLLYDHIEKEILLTEELEKFCEINNITFEDLRNLLIKQQFKRLKETVILYQKKGIKVKIINWLNDLVTLIKNDEILSSTFITLFYEDKEFETIQELIDYDNNLEIEHDFNFNKGMSVQDKHPNKKCHKIIADSIIKNIENEI